MNCLFNIFKNGTYCIHESQRRGDAWGVLCVEMGFYVIIS